VLLVLKRPPTRTTGKYEAAKGLVSKEVKADPLRSQGFLGEDLEIGDVVQRKSCGPNMREMYSDRVLMGRRVLRSEDSTIEATWWRCAAQEPDAQERYGWHFR
jgi:hypothetical protein